MKTKPNSPVEQFKSFVRQPYAWPSGYPLFAVCTDGACLCKKCAADNARQVIAAQVSNDRQSGWNVDVVMVNWEAVDLTCDNCGEPIESAYGE